MRARQRAHFWAPSVTARVNGELTMFDFEHELAGLVISTETARALYQSLGEQLGNAWVPAPDAAENRAGGKGELKPLAARQKSRWRARSRAGKNSA